MAGKILCIASYFKGEPFIQQCKRNGWYVVVVASSSDQHEKWPHDSIDEIYFMPDQENKWHMPDVVKAVSHLGRTHTFDRIVPLDDLDVENVAHLREHLRIEGMGETQVRYVRDKLAMREKAQEHNFQIPAFVHALNYEQVTKFLEETPAPWILKPRSLAGAMGIKKFYDKDALWQAIHDLGDEQSHYLIEQFIPGKIFHVDSIIYSGKVVWARAHQYAKPPFSVTSGGGIFISQNLPYGTPIKKSLLDFNKKVQKMVGIQSGVAHTEFIQDEQGNLYFLETAARAGGAHLTDMIEAYSGINLWREWANLETLGSKEYVLPEYRKEYGCILISVAKEVHPDMSVFNAPEVKWMISKQHHVGVAIASKDAKRIDQLRDEYATIIARDFCP